MGLEFSDWARGVRESERSLSLGILPVNNYWQWAFYIFFGVIEVVLTAVVVWYAWNWPKQTAT
jgi:hypothetical protein